MAETIAAREMKWARTGAAEHEKTLPDLGSIKNCPACAHHPPLPFEMTYHQETFTMGWMVRECPRCGYKWHERSLLFQDQGGKDGKATGAE